MKPPSEGLIGTFAGLLIVYLAQTLRAGPEEGLGPGLVFLPLVGTITGSIVERIRRRRASHSRSGKQIHS
jgi:hypothetical protein